MAEQENTQREGPQAVEDDSDRTVEAMVASMGGAYWWVDDCQWATVLPTLPEDLVTLLAPPILVGAVPGSAGTTDPP